MKRTTHRTPLDGLSSKVVVRYESELAPEGTVHYIAVQRQILEALLSNPGLLDCGTQPFAKLKMYHDGEKWVVELEAVST